MKTANDANFRNVFVSAIDLTRYSQNSVQTEDSKGYRHASREQFAVMSS